MKTLYLNLLVILLCIGSTEAPAQITSYKIEKKVVERIVPPYDSLTNITRNNLPSLVGQQVQVLPKKKSFSYENGPTLYTAKPTYSLFHQDNKLVVKPDMRSSTYESCYGAFYNEVFNIIGVDSVVYSYGYSTRYTDLFLIVKNANYPTPHYLKIGYASDDIKNGKVVKYEEPSSLKDFIILGYFEKLKAKYIGRKSVNKYTTAYNFETGKAYDGIPEDYIWTVKDLAIVESETYKGLCYVLTSDSIKNAFAQYRGRFVDYEEYAQNKLKKETEQKNWEKSMIKKYGATNGRLIIQGKVKIGFTKAMCRESWGSPDDINKSTGSWGVHEQWVYGRGSYLYFENGKLTSIDN